jgi:hypothetical protein
MEVRESMGRIMTSDISQPYQPIQVFLDALDAWTNKAFPAPRQQDDIGILNAMWRTLAKALAGSQVQHATEAPLGQFHQELVKHHRTAENGMPPRNALQNRLNAIVASGVDELFLVICLRRAIDVQIARLFPQAFPAWEQLADKTMAVEWQWSLWSEQRASQPSRKEGKLEGRPFPSDLIE